MIRYILYFTLMIELSISINATAMASDSHTSGKVSDIYNQVESLEIGWRGYVLGGKLNGYQMERAGKNKVPSATHGSSDIGEPMGNTYKFKDKELTIVVDSTTDRVVIIFETVERASQQKVQDMIGSLIISFKDPTLSAHDKIVYWAYGRGEKYSAAQFEEAKEIQEPLPIIATVKLQSEVPIMEKGQEKSSGRVYYIISSEPLLKQLSSEPFPKQFK